MASQPTITVRISRKELVIDRLSTALAMEFIDAAILYFVLRVWERNYGMPHVSYWTCYISLWGFQAVIGTPLRSIAQSLKTSAGPRCEVSVVLTERKMVRCKMQLAEVAAVSWSPTAKRYVFFAVRDSSTPENQKFSKYTPSGRIELQIDNPDAQAQYELGHYYYFDSCQAV